MTLLLIATSLAAALSGMPEQAPAGAGRTDTLAPLLPDRLVSALADETSGETAKRNLEFVARLHRMRGSRQFRLRRTTPTRS